MLALLATATACGDNRGKPSPTDDTTGVTNRAAANDSATASAETATTPAVDSTKSKAEDSSHAPSAKSDSAARAIATARPTSDTSRKRPQSPGPRPAKRVGTAAQDTGTKTSDTAAKAKSDSGTADTGKAKADSGTTGAVQGGELHDAYHQPPRDTVSEAVYDGWKQFNLNCARCHGEDVTGTTIAPHLVVSLRPDGPINTKELFVQTVCAGRPAKGMPAWCSLGLGMDKIQDIYSYVKGRSDGKIAPGRPAVRKGT